MLRLKKLFFPVFITLVDNNYSLARILLSLNKIFIIAEIAKNIRRIL